MLLLAAKPTLWISNHVSFFCVDQFNYRIFCYLSHEGFDLCCFLLQFSNLGGISVGTAFVFFSISWKVAPGEKEFK